MWVTGSKNASQQFLPGVGGASVLLLGRDYNMNVTSMITSYRAVTSTLSPDFFIDCLAYFNELPQHLESPYGKGLQSDFQMTTSREERATVC